MRDFCRQPFRRLVILGESTVEGGGWVPRREDRFADVLVDLINRVQAEPIEYHNKGIGANAISRRSPGYEQSRKPCALDRYRDDVIALRPDLFILCYGLNDMRAGMPLPEFLEDMTTILEDVRQACDPTIVLTTVYHMTGWRSFPPYDRGTPEAIREYNRGIRSLAAEKNCILADVWEAEAEADWLIHFDGVHANKVGNLVIACRIFEALAGSASGLSEGVNLHDRDTRWGRGAREIRERDGDPFRQTW